MMGVCTQYGKIEQLGLWTYQWRLEGWTLLWVFRLTNTGLGQWLWQQSLHWLTGWRFKPYVWLWYCPQHHPLREISMPISDSVKICDSVGTIWAHFASPAPLVITFIGKDSSVPSSAGFAPHQWRHLHSHWELTSNSRYFLCQSSV